MGLNIKDLIHESNYYELLLLEQALRELHDSIDSGRLKTVFEIREKIR